MTSDQPTVDRAAIRQKIEAQTDFNDRCITVFYDNLFETVPGAKALFKNQARQRSMFQTMLQVMIRDIADQEALDRHIEQLGKKHREKGVQSVHIKMGRSAFLNGIAAGCPSLSEDEIGFFSALYDKMALTMQKMPPRKTV